MLELQRNASHCRETSGRDESYLIVAVVVGMAAALAQCAVNPSALSVTLVEDIVQRLTYCEWNTACSPL